VASDRSDCVQFGSGPYGAPTWRNFDSSPSLRIQRVILIGPLLRKVARLPLFPPSVEYGDIVQGLPVRDGSCQLVYSSHVLEHLALNDIRVALRNTHRYLRAGGIFRLVLPDLERYARDYLASADPQAGNRFLSDARLGSALRARGVAELMRARFGSSAHLWMWDYKGLAVELAEAGFSGIRRAQFGDSSDTRFKDVEILERWNGCLGIECTR
jgi:predicted SAM-dependent methyltransferase